MQSILRSGVLVIFILLSSSLAAQQFDIQNLSVDNGKVIVNFKINEKYQHERYRIDVYSSHDNYARPLKYVTGSLEQDEIVSSDQQMQLIWDAQKELKNFDGRIQLKLIGNVSYIPIHMENDNLSAKQSKVTTISWDGGKPQDQINVELVKSGIVIKSLGQVSNSGTYNWDVDKSIDKGSGYSIRLVNLTNSGEDYESVPFKIGAKAGLAVKLAPVGALLIGGGVYYLTTLEQPTDKLPDAPNPTDN